MRDLDVAAAGVCAALGPAADRLTEGQYAACIDFAFNVGVAAFANATLSHYIRSGQLALVPNELRKWRYARVGGVETALEGLLTRRLAETRVWLT